MSQDLQLTYSDLLPSSAVTEDAEGIRELALPALHLSRGRIFLEGEINDAMANRFASAMLRLADEQQSAYLYINSPGGSVRAGLMMYDLIRSFPGECTVTCTGFAASMAAILLAGGQKGRRFILPHSRVMIHEPLVAGGFGGSATNIEKTAQEILKIRDLTNGIIAEATGRTLAEINAATVEDNFMNAQEAVDFGICDEIRSIY